MTKTLEIDPKPYLDYLDKEMTIMGILSALSVAAPAGILGTVMGKDGPVAATLWSTVHLFVIAGSIFCFAAAAAFYKERSTLAWFYGQISLVQARGGQLSEVHDLLNEWFRDADAWSTWWPYCWGITFLTTGFVEYLLAIIFFAIPAHSRWFAIHSHQTKLITFFACPIIASFTCGLQYFVRVRFRYSDNAWKDFFEIFTKRSKR